MRTDVEFDAEGVTLRGWLYRPDGGSARAPAVVMAHGFSAVKEMYLDAYADAFQASGLAVLVFDNRGFGASDGEPRQDIDPWAEVRDNRHAITWIQLQDGVDPDQIGVWGSSYSGGHVLVVGALDRRVRCVVSQVRPLRRVHGQWVRTGEHGRNELVPHPPTAMTVRPVFWPRACPRRALARAEGTRALAGSGLRAPGGPRW